MTEVNLLFRISSSVGQLIVPKLYLFPIDKVIPRQYLTFTQHNFNISLSKCDLNLKYFYPLAPTAWWKDDGGREQRG